MLLFLCFFAKIYVELTYTVLYLIHSLCSICYFPFKYIQHYVQITHRYRYDRVSFFLPKYINGFPLTIENIFCLCWPSLHRLCLSLQLQQAFFTRAHLLLKTHMFRNPSHLLGSDKKTDINYFLCLKVFLCLSILCFNHSSLRF